VTAGGSGLTPAVAQPERDYAPRMASPARTRARSPRLALLVSLGCVLAFVLLITLPFIGQALHLDDFLFWDFARNNLDHPLQQHLSDFHLMGQNVASFRDTHPPVDELYLSLIMRVTGSTDSAEAMHLGFIIFPLITGLSMFFLSRRFIRSALLATIMLLATPAVMVMSHNLMGDLPMTAFWLAATALYIYGADRGDSRLLAAAGLAATLAIFTGYQALALIVLLPFYSWLTGRLSLKTLLPLALPVISFSLFSWYNLAVYDALPRFSHAQGLSLRGADIFTRLKGLLAGTGGATVFPPAMAALFALRRKRYLLLPVVAAGAVALTLYQRDTIAFPVPTAILFAVFVTAAAMVLLMITTEAAVQVRRRLRHRETDRDFLFLAGWIVTIAGAICLLLPEASAKYYLPFLAPVVLLMFREAEAVIRPAFTLRAIVIAAIAGTLITGLALSAADYQLAKAYKDYARSISARVQTGGTVWFVGEWGFRHYMEAQGYKYLTTADTSPANGDLVVKAGLMDWPLDPSVTSRMRLVSDTTTEWDFPVRSMNFASSAGFYGSFWGLLPFSITDQPLEHFQIYRLEPAPQAGTPQP